MMNKYAFPSILPAILLALLPSGAAAHEALEEIRVTADPLSEVDSHFTKPVNILNKEELQRRSIQNIGEAIAREPGISSSDFGAGVGRPVIRGLTSGRVKVMEDNIGTMDASVTSADHAIATEPVFADSIEILRGPSTLLYGSGTSGGLVNIVNNKILDHVPEKPEGEALAQYETVSDGFLGAAKLNAGTGNFAVHLDGMIRDQKDYDIPGFASVSPDEDEIPGKVENSQVESDSVTGGASYINPRGFIGFSINRSSSDYGIPGHHHEEEEGEEEHGEEDGVTIDMEQIRYDFKAALDQPLSFISRLKTRWGYSDYEHREIEGDGEIATLFDIQHLEGRIEALHEPLGAWNGALGIHINNRDFSAVGEEAFVQPAKQDAVALFILEKGDFGDIHVDIGFRYEKVDSESSGGISTGHDLFSFSGGGQWGYTKGYAVGLSVNYNQRAPTIEELFSEGPHLATLSFDVGDSALGKEKSSGIDLYWRKTDGRFTFSANFFYNSISDFIFQQEQDLNVDGAADRVEEDFSGSVADILPAGEEDELLLLHYSQNDSDFLGFELEGTFNVFNDRRGNLDFRSWADYVEAELDNGRNLPRITPWRIGADMAYTNGPLAFVVDYTHTGKQDDTAPLESSTDGFNMLNLYAGYTMNLHGTDITLFARGSNLLNEEARRHTSFVKNIAPLPGRSGIFGLRASF